MTAAAKLYEPDNQQSDIPPFKMDRATVRQVLDWYKQNPTRVNRSKDADKERERVWKLFAEVCGSKFCTECLPNDLHTFINSQDSLDSDWTRKRWASTIQRPFNFAEKMGLIKNPFRGCSFPEGDNGRDWTDDEYRTLLRCATPHMRRVIVWIRFSGMRPGEMRTLEWTQVRNEVSAIVQEKSKTSWKTKTPRRVHFNRVMVKLLAWQKKNNPRNAKFVFLNTFSRPWSTKALTKNIDSIRRKASLSDDVKLHGGRHTFATRAIVNGVDIATLMLLLGHTKLATTQRYLHLAGKLDHLNQAMEKAVKKPT